MLQCAFYEINGFIKLCYWDIEWSSQISFLDGNFDQKFNPLEIEASLYQNEEQLAPQIINRIFIRLRVTWPDQQKDNDIQRDLCSTATQRTGQNFTWGWGPLHLGHHLGIIWGIIWVHAWGIIWDISGTCLGHHLGHAWGSLRYPRCYIHLWCRFYF